MLVAGPVLRAAVQVAPAFVERTMPALPKFVEPSNTLDVVPAPVESTTRLVNVPAPPFDERSPCTPVVHVLPPSAERRTPQPVRLPLPSPVAAYTIDVFEGSRANAPVVSPHSVS